MWRPPCQCACIARPAAPQQHRLCRQHERTQPQRHGSVRVAAPRRGTAAGSGTDTCARVRASQCKRAREMRQRRCGRAFGGAPGSRRPHEQPAEKGCCDSKNARTGAAPVCGRRVPVRCLQTRARETSTRMVLPEHARSQATHCRPAGVQSTLLAAPGPPSSAHTHTHTQRSWPAGTTTNPTAQEPSHLGRRMLACCTPARHGCWGLPGAGRPATIPHMAARTVPASGSLPCTAPSCLHVRVSHGRRGNRQRTANVRAPVPGARLGTDALDRL